MRFCILASGSKGNAAYVSHDHTAILVDCGLSGVELERRMERAGLDRNNIKAIFLTHEHRDHSKGAGIIARRFGIPLVTTQITWDNCGGTKKVRFEPCRTDNSIQIGPLEVTPFSIPHDASDTVGLVINAAGKKLGICTDLGKVVPLIELRLAGCNALVLEANHDPEMLAQGPYPQWLKQRVRGRHGHISNHESAELLSRLHHPELRHVVLAHLSETNNLPELARQPALETLRELNSQANLAVAMQDTPTEVFEI